MNLLLLLRRLLPMLLWFLLLLEGCRLVLVILLVSLGRDSRLGSQWSTTGGSRGTRVARVRCALGTRALPVAAAAAAARSAYGPQTGGTLS